MHPGVTFHSGLNNERGEIRGAFLIREDSILAELSQIDLRKRSIWRKTYKAGEQVHGGKRRESTVMGRTTNQTRQTFEANP